jgi:hypothetical protein
MNQHTMKSPSLLDKSQFSNAFSKNPSCRNPTWVRLIYHGIPAKRLFNGKNTGHPLELGIAYCQTKPFFSYSIIRLHDPRATPFLNGL